MAALKRLEDLNPEAQPKAQAIKSELTSLPYPRYGENLLLGPCDGGTICLVIALGLKVIEQGQRVCFLPLHDLVLATALRDRLL